MLMNRGYSSENLKNNTNIKNEVKRFGVKRKLKKNPNKTIVLKKDKTNKIRLFDTFY